MWIYVSCSDGNQSRTCIVEFPRGTCLPVSAISNVEHFWLKKKSGGVQASPLCVVIFFMSWETTGTKGRDGVTVLMLKVKHSQTEMLPGC